MSTDSRLTTLEQAMTDLALAQARTQGNLDRLSDEMRLFRDEMRLFRDEVRQSSREADRRLSELSVKMGEVSNRMGTLAEDIVAPSVPAVFQRLFGIERIESTVRSRRASRKDPARMREFDVLAWGGPVFLVNETKSRLRPEDIGAFVASLPEARDYLPEAQDRRIVGSLSAFYLDPTLVTAAERAGIYVFGLGSGLLQVLNAADFEPRRF